MEMKPSLSGLTNLWWLATTHNPWMATSQLMPPGAGRIVQVDIRGKYDYSRLTWMYFQQE
jgi:hypothetical protein